MKTNRSWPGLLVALATLLLAACASQPPAPVSGGRQPAVAPAVAAPAFESYTVKSGDTVYSIAREHGMDFRELIALNSIDSPNRIVPGKVLKVRPQGVSGAAAAAGNGVASTAPVTTEVVQSRPIGGETGQGAVVQKPLAAPSGNTEAQKREPKAGKEAYSEQALARAQAPVSAPAKVGEAPVSTKSDAKPVDGATSSSAAAGSAGADDVAWIWPASGKTLSTYNEGGNKGIDIGGKAGDPVLAAGDGKVIIANTLRGYGKLVIIKHNNTYVSVYGHNQTLLVKEGQMVSKGQKIAEMGNTDTDQVKLHFEVRSQGKPLDPMKFLPQR